MQISFRPVSYLTPLPPHFTRVLNKSKGSAYRRDPFLLGECVKAWVRKKYHAPAKIQRRNVLWPGLKWEPVLVHGRMKELAELKAIESAGVRLVPLETVLNQLCPPTWAIFTASAGGDLADLIEFYSRQK